MKILFKEGDDVAFKNNIGLKMTVKEIAYKTNLLPVKPKEDGSGFEREQRRCLDGIKSFWMKGSEIIEHKFHSDTLVPWDIATKGIDAVLEYLKNAKSDR